MELERLNGFDVTALIIETDNIDLPLRIKNMINNLFDDITGNEEEITRLYLSMNDFPKELKHFFFLENQKQKENFFIKSYKVNSEGKVEYETLMGDNRKEEMADYILKTFPEPHFDENIN